MSLPPWLNVSTGLVFTGVSLVVGLLGVAWEMGTIANGMNGAADNAATLNGQLRTVIDSIDVERVSSVPDDVERMTHGVERVTENVDRLAGAVDSLDSVDDSVDNNETAVTAVDLKGVERAVERLFGDAFRDGNLPTGNSVRHTLEESGVDVAISL